VLIFVGLKMTVLNRLYGGHFPITYSLGIIVGVIGISVVLSLMFPRKGKTGKTDGDGDGDGDGNDRQG